MLEVRKVQKRWGKPEQGTLAREAKSVYKRYRHGFNPPNLLTIVGKAPDVFMRHGGYPGATISDPGTDQSIFSG